MNESDAQAYTRIHATHCDMILNNLRKKRAPTEGDVAFVETSLLWDGISKPVCVFFTWLNCVWVPLETRCIYLEDRVWTQ